MTSRQQKVLFLGLVLQIRQEPGCCCRNSTESEFQNDCITLTEFGASAATYVNGVQTDSFVLNVTYLNLYICGK